MANNEVTLFKSGVPAYLKAKEPDAVTKSLIGGGLNTKRISIRGNVFRLVAGGKEIAVSEDRAMNIVIVNASPKVSRTFYAGKYVEGVNVSPTCWSADGDHPDPTAKDKQSDACATCPQNVKGSGDNNTRACKFNRLLSVLMENDMEGDLFQLSLPSQSIFGKSEDGKMPLNAYAQFLAGFNVNVTAVVTEMRFDINSSTPKLTFKAVRPLTEEEYELCTKRGASKEAVDMVKVSYTATEDEPEAPAKAEAPQPKAEAKPEPKAEAKPKAKAKAETPEESTPEPTKRDSKEKVPAKKDLASLMDEWDDEEGDK